MTRNLNENAPTTLVRIDTESLVPGAPLDGLILLRHCGKTYGSEIRIGPDHDGAWHYPTLDWKLVDVSDGGGNGSA